MHIIVQKLMDGNVGANLGYSKSWENQMSFFLLLSRTGEFSVALFFQIFYFTFHL